MCIEITIWKNKYKRVVRMLENCVGVFWDFANAHCIMSWSLTTISVSLSIVLFIDPVDLWCFNTDIT